MEVLEKILNEMNITTIILSLISLFIGGFLTHKYKWHFEKVKDKREDRKNLIKQLREHVSNYPPDDGLRQSVNYRTIKRHLKPEFIIQLDNLCENKLKSNFYYGADDNEYKERLKLREMFFEELNRIEKKWKLNV